MRETLRKLAARADSYFDEAHRVLEAAHTGPYRLYSSFNADYWSEIPDSLRETGTQMLSDVLAFTGKLAEASRTASLTSAEDTADVRISAKKLRAAIRFCHYVYKEAEIVHDEGTVLGLRPATQFELPHDR